MKLSLIIITAMAAMALTACGSTSYSSENAVHTSAPTDLVANGPIYSACRKAGRKQASRKHCGCVQGVAHQSLGPSEQQFGATFFDDPHSAQSVRQSDRHQDELFWTKWKEYGAQAVQMCT